MREDDLVLAAADGDRRDLALLRDPHHLGERAGRHVGLEGRARPPPRASSSSRSGGRSRWRPCAARDRRRTRGSRSAPAGSRRARPSATRAATVSMKGAASRETAPSPAPAREVGEVLVAKRAQAEGGAAGDDLDVLLGGAQLERDLGAGQGAHDVEQQPRWEHDVAGRLHGRASSGRRRPTSMSVARSSAVSPSAWSWTPESACTALRVEATRAAVCSSSRNAGVESFNCICDDYLLVVVVGAVKM